MWIEKLWSRLRRQLVHSLPPRLCLLLLLPSLLLLLPSLLLLLPPRLVLLPPRLVLLPPRLVLLIPQLRGRLCAPLDLWLDRRPSRGLV